MNFIAFCFWGCLVVGDGFVSLVCMDCMLGFLVVVVVHVGLFCCGSYPLGTTATNGSGSIVAVAYTAKAILQNTSSCVPKGCEKPMLPSLRKS